MLRLLACVFALSTIGRAAPEDIANQKETELRLVHIVFRHGERTPEGFYPNDPHANVTFYPEGFGGLTNKGKRDEYSLGKWIRSNYNQFLGDVFYPGIVEARSSDVERTKMSAQLVLAGLWPPSAVQMWNDDLPWLPIPVSYKPEKDEDLIVPLNCPLRDRIIEEQREIEEIEANYIAPHRKVMSFIEEKTGQVMKSPSDVLSIYFTLSMELTYNLTLPEWTQEIFPEPMYSVASLTYEYFNQNQHVRRINAGYMVDKVIKDSQAKIRNDAKAKKTKMFMYSGHESTLGMLLHALGVMVKPHIPPYGSAVMFELHESLHSREYFIKVLYYTGGSKASELTIPGCQTLCPLTTFIKLVRDLLPIMSYAEACQRIIPKTNDLE